MPSLFEEANISENPQLFLKADPSAFLISVTFAVNNFSFLKFASEFIYVKLLK
jgi:hypothetical protein